MARYIDAEKFLKSMIAKFKCVPLVGVSKYIQGEECFEGEPLDSLINEAPTVDVVEVVRCENCKRRVDYEGRIMCNKFGHKFQGEWYGLSATAKYHFCSYGERRDT